MATINLTSSSLVASFPGLNRANGSDQLELTATLFDLSGAPLEGATVAFMVSPVFRADVVGATTESAAGVYEATFTSKDASIKNVSLLVDGVDVGLTTQVEVVESNNSFLVTDPFVDNVGQLSSDLTISGQQITLKAEAKNSGAITEIIWNGQQLLNSLNKDRQLQTKVVKDNFGVANWAQLNESGALRQSWSADSSSRYIGDAQDLRHLVTQTFLSYREPVDFDGLTLDCSGDILTKHIGMDYLGNPNIFRVDFQNDQYASNKLGATSWAVSLGLVQTFTRFYTFAPYVDSNGEANEPVERALNTAVDVVDTTYMGGPIVANEDGTVAVGIFRAVRPDSGQLLSSFVRPQIAGAGDPKFTVNYCQLIDFEDSLASGGLAAGKHRLERFICVGTLTAVTNAFWELYYFKSTGVQNPGDPGPPPPPPEQQVDSIVVTAAPASVTRNAPFSASVRAVDFTGATVTDYNGSVSVSAPLSLGLTGVGQTLFVDGEATFSNLALSGSGSGNLVFTTQTITGPRTGTHLIGVENEVPAISSVTPDTAPDSLNGVDIQIDGLGLIEDSQAFFGNTPLTTTLVSPSGLPSYLEATIPGANLVQSSTPYSITVVNPPLGGGTSNAVNFTVTDGTAPELVPNSESVSVTGTTATLSWSTNEESVTRVFWGLVGQTPTELTFSDPSGNVPYSLSHLITLTNLADLSDYQAIIATEDVLGNANPNVAVLTWQTGDTVPPTITNVSIDAGSTNVTITASVDESCTVALTLSPTVLGSGDLRAANEQAPAVWSLGGLTSSTAYTYTLIATDPSGNQSVPESGTFTTDVGADTTPPDIISGPDALVQGLSATVTWALNEAATGSVYYRQQGTTGGYSTASSGQTGQTLSATLLLPYYETVYEYYVAGADLAGNPYQSDTFTFATGPDLTGSGGGLDPNVNDLTAGEVLTRLKINVPAGLSAGDSFIAHATVPVSRPSDLNVNWAVNGQVVQRHVNSYKPRAQGTSARYVHQLQSEQITHPAIQVQAPNNVLPPNWSVASGELSWSGGNLGDPNSVPAIRYYSDLTQGIYELNLRADAAYDVDEYFYVRVNGGAWQQAHGTTGTYGGYTDNSETTRISFTVGADEVGEYLVEIAGATTNTSLAWFALVPAGQTVSESVASDRVGLSDPTGPNSVEIVFPVTVPSAPGNFTAPDPQSPSDLEYFEYDLVATNAPIPAGTAQDGREIDQTKMVMAMPKPAVDAGYDAVMDAVIAGGAGTTLKSGPYMDEVVYYTRLTDASGNAGVGVHSYVRYYKADVDDSIYLDLNITNSHVDTARIVSGMSENAYVGSPGKIFFDQMYLATNDANYNIINGFGAETVTTPDGSTTMTVGDPYCGGPALGDDTTFFFVDYTDIPETELTRSHDGTGGIPARSEVFHAGAQRIEQVVLRPASNSVKSDAYATDVSQYQNVATTKVGYVNRNATQQLRWYGGNYYRSGELPETYVGQSPFPATLTGSHAYDRMRMNNAALAIKEVLSTGAIQPNRDFFEQGGIIDWADMTQFGCWTPGGSVDGSSSKNHMLNVYETAGGPGHTRGWAFFARTVLQRHSITAFDATGAPITIRHLYGTSAQAGATANESAVQVRNDRSGQAHGWSFFYERDEWVTDRFYSRGTQVRYNGQDYVCLTSHRASSAFPPPGSALWGAGSFNNSRGNQREFNGSYPIVAAADIDSGSAYTSNVTIECAYDTAWDQFTPISRDYIQRLYRCFMGLRLSVNPGIFNDYQRYQTELYLAAEDRFITQDVLNGGKTNDTLGHCLAAFTGTNAHRGFFHNDDFSDPGMQSDWGAGKAWAHWVIAQGLFFTAPEESYPAPVLGGEAYNRRQHLQDHVTDVRQLIANVMPGEVGGSITETYPATAASRRTYLNSRDDIPGFEDANVIGYVVNFATSTPFTLETLQGLLDGREYGEVEVRRNSDSELVGYMVGASAATGSPATLWVKQIGSGIAFTQGNVMKLTDNAGTKLPQASGHLLQVAGLEIDAREFSYAKTDELHINTHLWQCLAEAVNAKDNNDAKDLFRLAVDHAQFDLQNTGTPQARLNWNTADEVSGAGNGLYSEWTGRIAGTSTTFAGGVYTLPTDLAPTALNPAALAIDSSDIPYNTNSPANRSTARDGQSANRLPAVTGAYLPKVSSDWANLAWIAAHYSTRRLSTTSDPDGLLSPYLRNSYLRTGLGYETEESSPLLTYDASGQLLTGGTAAQRSLINSIVDPEERFAIKNRILAAYYAKDVAYENWYNTSPAMAEIDYQLRLSGADIAGIRLTHSGLSSGESSTPLILEAAPEQSTTTFPVTLTNTGIPSAEPTTVILSLQPDPEATAPTTFPGPSRLRLASSDPVVIPANTTQFSTQIGLVINEAEAALYDEPSQVGLLVASASGGTTESQQIPFILGYPTFEPSEVRFVTGSSSIQTGQTVTVQVSRNNSQQPVSVRVTSAGDAGFQVNGLTSDRLLLDTGVSVASFTVTYTQPAAGPGALTLTLVEDPNEPYTVSPIDNTHTITALVPVGAGDSEVVVARLGAGDGNAGPSPAALGLAPGDFTLVSATVPLVPAQAALPQFSMALSTGTPYRADAFAVARNADGAITVAQVTCPVIADDNGKVKHSIVDDATNPSVILRRYGVGDTIPGTVPGMQLNTLDLTNVRIELTDSDGQVYTFDPNAASQRSSYSGNYTRQVEYYGPMTTTDDELLIVRMIVTERSDLDAGAVDIIVENSKLSCAINVGTAASEVPNSDADGIVYFDSIKLVAPDHVIGHGAPHPSQGTITADYFLVKPYNEMHANSSNHGMLPGQWFARRVVLANAAIEANMISAIANRDDWGFVEGGLGFVQGGFGPADEGIPMLSKVAGLSYGGETGFRAAIERANTDRSADIADFIGANLPATSALGGGSQQWSSWGWFKGTSDSSTFKKPDTVKPFGVNVPSWRAANSLMALVDRTIERSGFAAFNTLTGYPVRDTEYRDGGQTPAAFNLFRNPALDINPWLWTNTAVPGPSLTTNWARAAASKQTDTTCAYLDTTGLVNWHANTNSLLDPTNLTQTDRDVLYGPYRGSASSRILQAYIPAIYMLNDRVAKVLCEYDANKAMFGFARYNQRGGGVASSRSPFGAAQSTFGLLFLATDNNSPYNSGASNTGIILKRQPNSAGGFDVRTTEIPGVEAWAGPALAISTAYLTGDNNTRQWAAPADPNRNWFSLISNVILNITSSSGVLGASVTNAVEVGLPRYTNGASNPNSYTGQLPGPQGGNGSITSVTSPTELSYQTLVVGELDLTWEYPDTSVYPEPDQFVIVRNGVDVATLSDGSLRTYQETGLSSLTEFTYEVRAEYGGASATSAPLENVFADGSDGSGGGTGETTFDGETDLPNDYWVPQTTFNYLIDLSDNTDTGTNILKTAASLFDAQLSSGSIILNPRASATPTRVAVLLPARTESNEVSVSRTGTPSIKAQFDLGTRNVEIHFVAPWVASQENRTVAAEEAQDDDLTYSYVYDVTPSGTNDIEIDGTYEVAHVQYHLWNWDIRLTNPMKLGRTVASTTANNRVYQEQDVYLHMCKVTGDSGLDVELTRLQLEGVYFDLDGATGSAITMDSIPYGNMNWAYINAYRVGKSFAQVRNSDALDSSPETGLRARIQSGSPGTLRITESTVDNYVTLDSSYAMFSWEGDHHAIEFGQDAGFFITTGSSTPPILRVFNDDTPDTTLGATNSFGSFCSGVTSSFSSGFFSNDPTDGVIMIDSAESISISGRISVGTGATNNKVKISTEDRGQLTGSAVLFRSLEFEDVNSNGNITNWLASLPNSPSGILPAAEGGTNAELLPPLHENENTYSNFQGSTNGEWNEAANDPFVPSNDVIDAVSMLYNDVQISKIARQFTREPRTEANFGGTCSFWARTRKTNSTYRMNPPTGTYADGTIDVLRIGSSTFADLASPTGATRGNITYTGDGTDGPNDGVLTWSNIVRTKTISNDGLGSLWEFNLGNGGSYTNTSLQAPWFKPWSGTSSTFGLYYTRPADIGNDDSGPRPGQGHIKFLNCFFNLIRGGRPLEITNGTGNGDQGVLINAISVDEGSTEGTGPTGPSDVSFQVGPNKYFLGDSGGFFAIQDPASEKWEIFSYTGKTGSEANGWTATGVRRISNRSTHSVVMADGVTLSATDYNLLDEAPNYSSGIYGAARTWGHYAGNDPLNYGVGNNLGKQFVAVKSVASDGTGVAVFGADANGNIVNEPETRAWPAGSIVKKVNLRSSYTKWGTRQYNTPRMTVEDSDWLGIRIEHGFYVSNLNSSFTARRCRIEKCAGQGFQFQHRDHGYQNYPNADGAPYQETPAHVIEDCHFIDNEYPWKEDGGRAATSLQFQDPGCSEFGGSLTLKDCSFIVLHKDVPFDRLHRASGVPEWAKALTYSTMQQSGPIYGPSFANPTVRGIDNGPTVPAAAAASNWGTGRRIFTMLDNYTAENCLYHRGRAGRAAIKIVSTHTLKFKDCAFREDVPRESGYSRVAFFDVDGADGYLDYSGAFSSYLVFENCVAIRTRQPLAQLGREFFEGNGERWDWVNPVTEEIDPNNSDFEDYGFKFEINRPRIEVDKFNAGDTKWRNLGLEFEDTNAATYVDISGPSKFWIENRHYATAALPNDEATTASDPNQLRLEQYVDMTQFANKGKLLWGHNDVNNSGFEIMQYEKVSATNGSNPFGEEYYRVVNRSLHGSPRLSFASGVQVVQYTGAAPVEVDRTLVENQEDALAPKVVPNNWFPNDNMGFDLNSAPHCPGQRVTINLRTGEIIRENL